MCNLTSEMIGYGWQVASSAAMRRTSTDTDAAGPAGTPAASLADGPGSSARAAAS